MSMNPEAPKPRQLRPPENPESFHASDPEQEASDALRAEHLDYMRHVTSTNAKPKRIWLRVLIVVTLIVAVVLAVYLVFFPNIFESKKKVSAPTVKTTQTTPTQNANAPIKTKHYDSTNFGLGFDYPQDWTVADVTGKLTVTSPAMQLATTANETITGQVIVTIQPKQATLDVFKQGNATAVIDSQKITYTKPTASQRAQTYLSFLNYASSADTGIDGVYVTGDYGYQKDQAIPQVDIAKVDPLIMVTFVKCSSSACNGPTTAATLAPTAWSDTAVLTKDVLTTLTSLAVQ